MRLTRTAGPLGSPVCMGRAAERVPRIDETALDSHRNIIRCFICHKINDQQNDWSAAVTLEIILIIWFYFHFKVNLLKRSSGTKVNK